MGLSKDLKFKGNDFSNVGSAFFIAYLIAEVPTGEFWLGDPDSSMTIY
jgi:hypothetical protein